MRRLVDTKFEYPFENNETPMQYGYHLMGKEELAKQNIYSILYSLGRMASFDAFMEGRFAKLGTMPERVKGFGYDLDAVVLGLRVLLAWSMLVVRKGRCCWRSRMLIRICYLTALLYKTEILMLWS